MTSKSHKINSIGFTLKDVEIAYKVWCLRNPIDRATSYDSSIHRIRKHSYAWGDMVLNIHRPLRDLKLNISRYISQL